MHASGVPYGLLGETSCKEQVSIAYAHAVATAARCSLEDINVDYQTVDATIRQTAAHDLWDLISLDVQLKCTSQQVLKDDHVAFSLETKYYDHLRSTRRQNDIILVVMLVPSEIECWVEQSEDTLNLARAAYWTSLRGNGPVDTATTTVKIPRQNVFNVAQLLGILSRIGDGAHP